MNECCIPYGEFREGQQIKIFDSYEQSWWPHDDICDFDEETKEILGKIWTIESIRRYTHNPKDRPEFKLVGTDVDASPEDVEYIVGGYGDFPDFVLPDVSELSGLLFA